MKKHIVVFRKVSDALIGRLLEHFEVSYFPSLEGSEDPGFRTALASAHGLLGASLKLDRALLDTAPSLEAIASISVGYDNYDLAYLAERGIVLTNTPDVLTETTADTAFMLIMMACRRAFELAEHVKSGHWKKNIGSEFFGSDVHHKTLGILGLGRIGAAVARRGHLGFGMPILYYNQSARPEAEAELGARRCSLDELLQQADIVCCTVPLMPSTERLIGAREFSLMGPQTVFVNASRGKVVDEAALVEALRQGHIKAAGLDVFEQEPLAPDSPLPQMRNVTALPHIGSATVETRAAMQQCAVENLSEALLGRRPPNLVDAAVWERRGATD